MNKEEFVGEEPAKNIESAAVNPGYTG